MPTNFQFRKNRLFRYSKVPFLNGGLFECLDKDTPDSKGRIIYSDGFSRKKGRQSRAYIPNILFFDETKGIVSILNKYNFTIEENSPLDVEVALDPELLGKVFENLLGTYNPETKETARKQSGSFYTPREIVQYMVDESLVAHLKRTVGDELETEYRKLINHTDEPVALTNQQKSDIFKSLKACKILDPACGSGAFPMGILNRMLAIIERLPIPANISVYDLKLYLIENCIYGIDIQSIAVQISKLRFFISLICEQQPTADNADNFGIKPLPNLETKFVAANTLIGLTPKNAQRNLFEDPQIDVTRNELMQIRHKHFLASTSKQKKECRDEDKKLREKLAKLLDDNGNFAPDDARQLADWNPYDQNASSNFFDTEWMFGIKDGFDVVIGNPPYVRPHKLSSEIKVQLWKHFSTFEKKADLYVCFIEKGVKILNDFGILTLIVSNGCLRLDSFENLRKFILKETSINLIVDFENDVFESATVKTCILSIKRSNHSNLRIQTAICNNSCQVNDLKYKTIPQSKFDTTFKSIFDLSSDINLNKIKDKLHIGSESLGSSFKICFGLKTGDDEKFLSTNRLNDTYKKLLRGENIDKYRIKFQGEYVFFDTDEMKRHKKTARPGTSERFEQPKILIRDTGGGLRGTFDNDGYYVKDVLVVEHTSKSTTLLKKLIGLLNSKLMSFYYDTSFPTLHVQRDELASLPIKSSLITNVSYNIVPDLVDQILLAKQVDPKADTSVLEMEIDRLVYELYGLTEEEIAIIENK